MAGENDKLEDMSENVDKLVKIIAYDEDGKGESFWAKPLGKMLYEVQNIVMFAPGLHPEDIVRCVEREGALPEVVEVVQRSKIRTIGVIFSKEATTDQIVDVLWELRKMGIAYEKAADRIVALGVPAESDFDAAMKILGTANGQIVEHYHEIQ